MSDLNALDLFKKAEINLNDTFYRYVREGDYNILLRPRDVHGVGIERTDGTRGYLPFSGYAGLRLSREKNPAYLCYGECYMIRAIDIPAQYLILEENGSESRCIFLAISCSEDDQGNQDLKIPATLCS